MPVRPEISLGVRQPKFLTPADALTLKDLVTRSDLHGLQLEEAHEERGNRNALRQIYGDAANVDTGTGALKPEAIRQVGAINPALAGKLSLDQLNASVKQAELASKQAETAERQGKVVAQKEEYLNANVRGPAFAAYEAALPQGEETARRAGQAAFTQGLEAASRSGMFGIEEKGQFAMDFDPQRVSQRLQQSKDWIAQRGAAAGRAETERHNKATEAQRVADSAAAERRAKEASERETFGQPFEATGPDGKPRLVVQNKKTGAIVDANTRQPVGGVGPKPGEASQKQITGVETTRDAIKEYRTALKGWSATDIASPDARAKMGTIYNNMLLQAKEAYNLGVLNGPDYMILQQVITNPASLVGGITSKGALDTQAKKLDEIMGRIGTKVRSVQTGVGGGGEPEARKTINGKNYIKQGGKWFEE